MEEQPADTMPAPAGISLADVAGTWNVRVMPETSDSTVTTYVLNATADPTGWTMNFPDREPIPVSVVADGDSIVTDAGPFESVLRPGVMVTTHGAFRLHDGMLMGTLVAHYQTTDPDSVRVFRSEGTRAP